MIVKRRHTKNYAVVPNAILEDRRLSAEARGVLAYLLSRPNNWEINLNQLRKEFEVGKEKIERIMREIIDGGYATRERSRSDDGRHFAGYDYTITDDPAAPPTAPEDGESLQAGNPPTDDPLQAGSLSAENLSAENPPTDIVRTSTKDGFPTKGEKARARDPEAEPEPHVPNADLLDRLRTLAPTTPYDSAPEVDTAWRSLTVAERREAVDRYPEWLEGAKKLGRGKIAGLVAYLREKRWQALAAKAETVAGALSQKAGAFDRAWWWLFWDFVARFGERLRRRDSPAQNHLRSRISLAQQYAIGWTLGDWGAPADIASVEERALALVQMHKDDERVGMLRDHARALGVDLPIPDKAQWIYAPADLLDHLQHQYAEAG